MKNHINSLVVNGHKSYASVTSQEVNELNRFLFYCRKKQVLRDAGGKMSRKEINKNSDDELARLPYFNWDKAKYFYHAAKLGSFSATAEFFNIDQSAISRKISSLEYDLKCQLFIRLPRGIKLTQSGEKLFAIIEKTFLEFREFAYYVDTKNKKNSVARQRKIRIVSTYALATYVLNDLLALYNEKKPHLIFELIGNDNLIDIPLNNIDIAIRPLDSRIKGEDKRQNGVQYDYLFSIQKRLYAAQIYLGKYGIPQKVEDLKDHRLLAYSSLDEHPYADINWALRLGMPDGEFHKPVFTSNSVEILINAAKNGVGIVSSYKEFNTIRDSNLVNILPDIKHYPVRDYFIYPDYYKDDEEILGIRDYLKSKLDK